ncbi:hypothetical protein AFCDBAGC_4000 [Methylobacterium cerastii]|uniref:DUF1508 domain-containing protein n=1 Tax=Methylobacterium cerastii TaxID=932741 RepID=A0ABQ4QMU7_9HYPH|nr:MULTISPECIES: hypothetical protein [Methylobacterium]TXM87587.1 hypothetical protein FV219_25755 [Methylobacterium sp. WL122]TXN78700.1 hypothetical protein FV234_22330 [Methylobacterium sp. WL8]GJD46120.1 hypothetical protein AFCDBAGC_4000 [Methylobacterium cerastii]
MEDPTPVAVEARDDAHGRYRWHLTDAGGVSVRVSPETYATDEDAIEAGQAALDAFGAADRS